jgi:hypothetical protein
MTRSGVLALAVIGGAIFASVAYAQEARPPAAAAAEDSQRYEFTAMSRYGFMRMDRQTGQVSHCRSSARGWACEPIADDRAAYDAEIARQKTRISELEAEVARQAGKIAALEAEAARRPAVTPGPAPAPAPQTQPRPEVRLQLPSDEEVERALRYLESVFKRFIGIVDRLRTEKESGRT